MRSNKDNGAVVRRWTGAPPRRSAELPVGAPLPARPRSARRAGCGQQNCARRPHRARPAPACRRRSSAGCHPAAMIRISVGPATKSIPSLAGDQFLGGGNVDVSGADDAVDLRHGFRAVGEGSDGLRAAHLEDVRDSEPLRDAQNLGDWAADTPRTCSAHRPPAPGSRSSAAWRAADSGPRECRRPSVPAAARSVPAGGRPGT